MKYLIHQIPFFRWITRIQELKTDDIVIAMRQRLCGISYSEISRWHGTQTNHEIKPIKIVKMFALYSSTNNAVPVPVPIHERISFWNDHSSCFYLGSDLVRLFLIFRYFSRFSVRKSQTYSLATFAIPFRSN